MNGLRGAGLLCVFFACCLAGMEKESRMKQRWLLLRELQELLVYLEKDMTCHRSPLPEALQNAAAFVSGPLGALLALAAEGICKRAGNRFEEIWEEAVRAWKPASFLTEAEQMALLQTAAALCSTDTVMLGTLLLKYAQRFSFFAAEAEKQWQEKGRLYRRLAAAAGVFFVIFLL